MSSRTAGLLFGGLLAFLIACMCGRVALRHFGLPHQRFKYGSASYHREFAAACDSLLLDYGSNSISTIYRDPECVFPNFTETNYVSEGERFARIPIAKVNVSRIITDLNPLFIVVFTNNLVAIHLYRPASGGFHIYWSRRQWSGDNNSLQYTWDPEGGYKTVYREEPEKHPPAPAQPFTLQIERR